MSLLAEPQVQVKLSKNSPNSPHNESKLAITQASNHVSRQTRRKGMMVKAQEMAKNKKWHQIENMKIKNHPSYHWNLKILESPLMGGGGKKSCRNWPLLHSWTLVLLVYHTWNMWLVICWNCLPKRFSITDICWNQFVSSCSVLCHSVSRPCRPQITTSFFKVIQVKILATEALNKNHIRWFQYPSPLTLEFYTAIYSVL